VLNYALWAKRFQTNLIVAPVALIRQWEEEIRHKLKSSHPLSVFIYHGKRATVDHLRGFDVVLTTYGTVAQEVKRLEKWWKANEGRNVDTKNDRELAAKCPLLHPAKAKFYRIILDEAQCIKNEKTQQAKACCKLQAEYRWCLSGTPMMNGVQEMYSLVHFLRIQPFCIWDEFRKVSATNSAFTTSGD
jgi:SNF2 family DNA or RNA helicase